MDVFKIKNVQQLDNFINEGGDIFDYDDETPLFKKHVQKNPELFRAFVEAGIDINALNGNPKVTISGSVTTDYREVYNCIKGNDGKYHYQNHTQSSWLLVCI